MRGTVAKRIRKSVYGDDVSGPAGRLYFRNKTTGQIVCGTHIQGLMAPRTFYQQSKKVYREAGRG